MKTAMKPPLNGGGSIISTAKYRVSAVHDNKN